MSQNLEQFGVEAVWLNKQFQQGLREDETALKRADKATKKATDSMADSWQRSDAEISKLVSGYVADTQRVAAATKKLPKEAKSAAGGFKLSFTEIFSAVQLVIGGIKTLANVAREAFALAREGAEQLGQARGFAIASGGAEQAATNLEAMRAATRGTATDAQLMAQGLGVLATGLAQNETELFQVTRNITTLAKTFKGFGAERALLSFQLLATDLQASKARLDDFGLTMADVKPRIDALVASGMDLQEATRAALLEATDEKMEQLGLTTATTADSFGQAEAEVGNLANQFKQSLAPAGAIVADVFVRALTNTESLDSALRVLAETGIKVASVYAGVTAIFDKYVNATGAGIAVVEVINGNLEIAETFQDAYNESVERGTQSLEEASGVADVLTQATEELGDATVETAGDIQKFTQAIAQARTSALEAFIKRAISLERQLEDAAIARARKVQDIERQAVARRAQIEAQFAATVAGIQDQAAEDRRTRQVNLARQLEQIERNYQERKRAIQQAFGVSFSRAVRSRDALALVEAIRTRKRDLDEAKRARDQERTEATTDAARQEEEQQRSLERQLEAARVARAQQIAEAQSAQEKQLEDWRWADQRQAEDRARADARWLQDQQRAFQDRQARAMAEYRQNEDIYRQHLQRMLRLTNQMLPRIFPPQLAGGGGRPLAAGGGGGPTMLADGGAFIASGATPFVAGEAGPELVIAAPLSQIANVNPVGPQAVGQMRHDVSGQIQASMAGFQGRLTAAINDAVTRSIREVLR